MATLQECEAALADVAARLAAVDPGLRRRYAVDRTVSCRVDDLGVVFVVRLTGGDVVEQHCWPAGDATSAQVRLTATSDDLVSLVAGDLSLPVAWSTGRLRIEASVLDLVRLRALL